MTGKSAFADKIVCALIRDEDTGDSSKLLQLYLVHSIERWEASNVYNDLLTAVMFAIANRASQERCSKPGPVNSIL